VTAARESLLVELVDAAGRSVGSATVADAHTAPGRLHRAFSVFLVDADGRTLLQRRAATKTRFPLRWANACCGHPTPGENVAAAAARRLVEEIGVAAVPLDEIGVYSYRAQDAATGRVEHEYDHVLVGRASPNATIQPDPAEVSDVRWIAVDDLRADLGAASAEYVPWLTGVLAVWLSAERARG